jgi:hypothetical protein
VAIALAQAHAGVHGCVFDWPETVAVAAANIAHAQLSDRLETLGGDLDSDDIGGDYDLVWCSSVLHFVPDMAAAAQDPRGPETRRRLRLRAGGNRPAPGDAARVLLTICRCACWAAP